MKSSKKELKEKQQLAKRIKSLREKAGYTSYDTSLTKTIYLAVNMVVMKKERICVSAVW